jgi:hypothetical protein
VSDERKHGIELDVDGKGTGSVKVGGTDMSSHVTGIGIQIEPGNTPYVKLRMRPGLAASLAEAEVMVDSATAGALIELGWTPPGGHTPKLTESEALAYLKARWAAGLVEIPRIDDNVSDPKFAEFVLTWRPLDPDAEALVVPLNQHWVFPAEACGEFRLSTREVPASDEPMLCDGCGCTDKPVEATDDGRALACPDCRPVANAANDPALVVDLLALVCVSVPQEQVEGWTEEQRQQAARWAVAVHLSASDNDDVEVPPRPAFLDEVSGG